MDLVDGVVGPDDRVSNMHVEVLRKISHNRRIVEHNVAACSRGCAVVCRGTRCNIHEPTRGWDSYLPRAIEIGRLANDRRTSGSPVWAGGEVVQSECRGIEYHAEE